MFTAKQSRMARVALNWTTSDLAERAGFGRATVARFEGGHNLAEASISAMQTALEAAGASFSAADDRVAVSVPI